MKKGITFSDVLLIPKYSEVESRSKVNLSTLLTPTIPIGIPIISSNMSTITEYDMAFTISELGGIGVIHRFMEIKKETEIVRRLEKEGIYPICASVGVKEEEKDRAEKLFDSGINVFVVDTAHGNSSLCLKMIEYLKNRFDFPVIAGNVATKEGAKNLIESGADAIKVGINPGGTCTTGLVTGCGMPQLTAIMNCFKTCDKYNIPLIADGGIRNSGDVVKALAAGASTVMLGSLLSGTTETPGNKILYNGKYYKEFIGMSSGKAGEIRRGLNSYTNSDTYIPAPEGIESLVEFKGSVKNVIFELLGGVRSGLSYCGAFNIEQLQANAEFIRVSESSREETKPRGIILGTKL